MDSETCLQCVAAAPGAAAEAGQTGPGTPEVEAGAPSPVQGAPQGAKVEKVCSFAVLPHATSKTRLKYQAAQFGG